jgi:hypothetical protein
LVILKGKSGVFHNAAFALTWLRNSMVLSNPQLRHRVLFFMSRDYQAQ